VTLWLEDESAAVLEDLPVKGCALRCVLDQADYDRTPRLQFIAVHLFPMVQKETRIACVSCGGALEVEQIVLTQHVGQIFFSADIGGNIGLHLRHRFPKGGKVGVGGIAGGQLGGGTFDQGAGLKEIVGQGLIQHGVGMKDAAQTVRGEFRDEISITVALFHHTHGGQSADGLPQRDTGDAQRLGKFTLSRQPVSRSQLSAVDAAQDVIHDLLAGAGFLDCFFHDALLSK
jgi:hypothetical protein